MGAQGFTTVDFGAFPGQSDASTVITGQAGIVSGSLVEAWLRPVTTADHTDTEHMVETLSIFAGNIVAGVGFTIYMFNTSQVNEPEEWTTPAQGVGTTAGTLKGSAGQAPSRGGQGTRIYGVWTVAWVWN